MNQKNQPIANKPKPAVAIIDQALHRVRLAKIPVAVTMRSGQIFSPALVRDIERFGMTLVIGKNEFYVMKHAIDSVALAPE